MFLISLRYLNFETNLDLVVDKLVFDTVFIKFFKSPLLSIIVIYFNFICLYILGTLPKWLLSYNHWD